MTSGCDSRSDSRPRQWSRSPLVSRIPAMGECRSAFGHSSGQASICRAISGDALIKNQDSPSALRATDSCVRGRTLPPIRRPSRQLKQPQFHCGAPPPAAEPRTRTFTAGQSCSGAERLIVVGLAVVTLDDGIARIAIGEIALIAAYFRAHVDLDEGRGFPFHGFTLSGYWPARRGKADILPVGAGVSRRAPMAPPQAEIMEMPPLCPA